MRKYPSSLMAVLAILMLILAACTGDGGASASAAASEAANGLCRPVGDATAPASPEPETAEPGSSELKVGLVTDVGTLDDRNFNQYSWEGALLGAAILGAPEPQSVITTESSEYEGNIQSFIDEDYNVIVTVGFALGEATLAAAEANPDIHFIGVDQFQANDPIDNYESLIFNEAQAGYLAGIVAASISESGEIAAIGGSGTIPPVVNYMRGYENGAHSVNPDANVQLKYISDDLAVAFNDPTAGKTFADQFLQQNADVDVMFQVAGKTGNGVLQSVDGCRHLRHRRRRRPVGLQPGERPVHRHQRREEADQGGLRGHRCRRRGLAAQQQRLLRRRQRGHRPGAVLPVRRISSTTRSRVSSTMRSPRWPRATWIRASRRACATRVKRTPEPDGLVLS